MRFLGYKFLFVCSFIVLAVVVHQLTWTRGIEAFFRNSISKQLQFIHTWKTSNTASTNPYETVEALAKAYTTLQYDYAVLMEQLVKQELLLNENTTLRKQLHFFDNTSFSHVGADVIAKNIDPLENTMVLNRGSSDQIKKGDPIIVNEGIFVGQIDEVFETTSIATLINDNKSKIAATTPTLLKSIGLIEGGYGISIRMNFIPQNIVLSIGDIIVTSGLEQGIPPGLIIGKVESVEKEPYKPFQQAILTPLIDLDTIQTVSVITDDRL